MDDDGREERLQQLYEDAGRPGARQFRVYVRRNGENITQAEALRFVQGQASRQVISNQRQPSDGKISASREDARWQVDIMDMTGKRVQNTGEKHALQVTDIFSRYTWTVPMKSKSADDTLRAYQTIIQQKSK